MSSTILDQRLVTNALLEALRAAAAPDLIGDIHAPDDAGPRYGTLLHLNTGPGGGARPETELVLDYRVRSVGVDVSVAGGRFGPRWDAEALATILRRRLLDRSTKIEGPGWRVTGREWMSSASDAEGRTVNVMDDYRFRVSPR